MVLLGLALLAGVIASTTLAAQQKSIPVRPFKVIHTYPHDTEAFTQGLLYHDGHLIESTGQYGSSQLRRVEISTGKVLRFHALSNDIFAEGIALRNDRIYQLTWMNRYCLVSDMETLKPHKVIPITFSRQGWGLTWDGHSLIASDGSHRLYFLDPDNLSLRRTLNVTAKGRPIHYLNELEIMNGKILANVWQDNRIAVISPLSGRVTEWIDCTRLVPEHLGDDAERVLNGIAFRPSDNRLFITGKQWPVLYLIELQPLP